MSYHPGPKEWECDNCGLRLKKIQFHVRNGTSAEGAAADLCGTVCLEAWAHTQYLKELVGAHDAKT